MSWPRIPERYGRTAEVRLAAKVGLAGGGLTFEQLVTGAAPAVGTVLERRGGTRRPWYPALAAA